MTWWKGNAHSQILEKKPRAWGVSTPTQITESGVDHGDPRWRCVKPSKWWKKPIAVVSCHLLSPPVIFVSCRGPWIFRPTMNPLCHRYLSRFNNQLHPSRSKRLANVPSFVTNETHLQQHPPWPLQCLFPWGTKSISHQCHQRSRGACIMFHTSESNMPQQQLQHGSQKWMNLLVLQVIYLSLMLYPKLRCNTVRLWLPMMLPGSQLQLHSPRRFVATYWQVYTCQNWPLDILRISDTPTLQGFFVSQWVTFSYYILHIVYGENLTTPSARFRWYGSKIWRASLPNLWIQSALLP